MQSMLRSPSPVSEVCDELYVLDFLPAHSYGFLNRRLRAFFSLTLYRPPLADYTVRHTDLAVNLFLLSRATQ